jgi:hypothetical protein
MPFTECKYHHQPLFFGHNYFPKNNQYHLHEEQFKKSFLWRVLILLHLLDSLKLQAPASNLTAKTVKQFRFDDFLTF